MFIAHELVIIVYAYPPLLYLPTSLTDSSSSPTVWIIDDDEDDRLFIGSAFANAQPPIQVRLLNDGADLIPELTSCTELPRLILLDINMPFKNGFEAPQEVRSYSVYAHLPVVMLTTSTDEQDRQRCLALGAKEFLTKPLSYDQLQRMAQRLSQQ